MDEATRRSAADSLDAMLHMVLFAVEAVTIFGDFGRILGRNGDEISMR